MQRNILMDRAAGTAISAAVPMSRPRSTSATLISVIVPVYQGERFILGAVASVLRQTHAQLELWVVDDGSTDATLERLATVNDPRLHVIRQANAGTGAARNAALARASGEYIAFLDCDDRWFPTKLETELALLEAAADPVGVAYSAHYAVDNQGRLLHAAPVRKHTGNVLNLLLGHENFLIPSLCLFHRRIFDVAGRFDPRCYHEDHEFILRVARHFPVYPTGRRLAVYRQTTGGKDRGILRNYEAARSAESFIADQLVPHLSNSDARRLREQLVRSLYVRFLMYGFDNHARRLAGEVDLDGLRKNMKGRLGWLFAKTGINLVAPARLIVQTVHRSIFQGWWKRHVAAAGLELSYD